MESNDNVRILAAKQLAKLNQNLDALTPQIAKEIILDLQVKNIELEKRNNELNKILPELDNIKKKYNEYYNSAPVGFLTLSHNGIINEANLTAADIFGVDLNKLLNQSITNFIYNEDVEKFKFNIDNHFKKEGEYQFYLRINNKYEEKWIYVVCIVIKDNDGELNCKATVRDIHKPTIVEEALKNSEERFRKLFAESLIPIAVFDQPFKFKQVNQAFIDMMGYSEEELKNMTFKDISHPDNLNNDIEYVTRLIKGEISSYKTEKKYITKYKEVKWGYANVSVLKNNEGKFLSIVVMINDITERKFAEEALRNSREQYRKIFFESSIGMVSLNKEFQFLQANQAFVTMIGYSENELKQMTFEDITHPEYLKQDLTNVNMLLREEITNYKTEKKYIAKNNEIKWGLVNVTILRDDKAKFISFLAMIIDITDRKQAEFIIQEQNLKLKEHNATKDKFFSIIAHDLRNSFNSILGFSDLLQINAVNYSVEEIKNDVKIISDSASQTYKLLENLLEWSRVQSGKLRTNIKKHNIKNIVSEVCYLFEEMCVAKNLSINNTITSDIDISCDDEITKTILRNLIYNSIKFTNPNGKISVSSHKTDLFTLIQVSDNGIGISPERISQLFSIDKDISTKGTANEKGSGLGLILCKELIELQGGRIRVESEEGKGTIVSLLLKDIN